MALTACATGLAGPDDSTSWDDQDGAAAVSDAAPKPKPSNDAGTPKQDASSSNDASQSKADSGSSSNDSGTTTSTCTPFTGKLASFDLSGEPGDQTSTSPSALTTNLSATDLTRSSVLTATLGTSSINSSNWALSTSIDTTRYYTLTLTPKNGCTMSLSSVSITTQASSTGPAHGALATSFDKFVKTTSVSVGATATPSLSVSGATGAVEIRIYGYDASSTAGTLRIDSTLTVSGSLQ